MNKEGIISSGLLELYAIGLSSAEEAKQVELWITQYPEIKQELEAIELSLESYATAHSIEPPSSVKAKIFASINEVHDISEAKIAEHRPSAITSNVYRIPTFFSIAAAAMLILLLGSIILNYTYYNKYKSATGDLEVAKNDLQTARQNMQQSRQVTSEMTNEMNIIGDKNSIPVVLNGTPHAPDAVAKIYWVKPSGEVYVDPTNLPSVPSGKQYQLWAMVDGKPVDAGMISTDKGTYHIQKMKSFGHAQAFAITLEKAGGSKTPTMDQMYVISKV